MSGWPRLSTVCRLCWQADLAESGGEGPAWWDLGPGECAAYAEEVRACTEVDQALRLARVQRDGFALVVSANGLVRVERDGGG